MLRSVTLAAFKCFTTLELPLGRLTLLSGTNAAGKSTVLQALVLLHQALAETGAGGALRTDLPLNGSLLTLGSIRDVVSNTVSGRSFFLGVASETLSLQWRFRGERDALAAEIQWTHWNKAGAAKRSGPGMFPTALTRTKDGRALLDVLSGIRFVPADRVGPAEVYPLLEPERHRSLGPRAERAVGVLVWAAMLEQEVARGLRHPNPRIPARLDRQVEAWLGDLFPGIILDVSRVTDVQGIPTANLATLRVRTREGASFHRPQHVGFGIAYALPIVVALMASQPGDLVLLENPEAHLHPRAQVRIGAICARAARSGTQLVIESHSDHILNSIRVAVKRGALDADQVAAHFFTRTFGAEAENAVEQVVIEGSGRLGRRPDGFFDEIERQLSDLLGSE